jgi:hypothetical protein
MKYLLVTEHSSQFLTDKQAKEGDDPNAGMFPCGHCSVKTIKVYHNLFGKHRHLTNDQKEELIKSYGWTSE